MTTQGPLPAAKAWPAVARCFAVSVTMLGRRQLRTPRRNVGRRLRFADGSTARVYRETVALRPAADPCLLVVSFRLRWVRGSGHTLFRIESILNTPLFVGFPGFVSKLWLAHDHQGTYRGLYEWDGAAQAEHYARSLWRVLGLVSAPGTIHYRVFPGLRRDEVLAHPAVLAGKTLGEEEAWCRVVTVA